MFIFNSIHNKQEYNDRLIELLNSQWPRSSFSRQISIDRSNENLPYYLMMIDSQSNELVGCASISIINSISNAILIENVLIKSIYRGKGYGRIIMNEIENISKQKGFEIGYLSTNDQKDFYKRLGYIDCEPISTSSFLSTNNSNNNNDDEDDHKDKASNLLRIFGGGSLKKKEIGPSWLKKEFEV